MFSSISSKLKSSSGLADLEIARSIRMGGYLESFLVSAIVAVLAIRAFLEVTGYPQISGRGLHVAHMLWGGLLMMVAMILLLSLLGHGVKSIAAVLGGLGFGAFIDELGKVITADHDYFFQPTIALIYVTFVFLFIVFRAMERRRKLGKRELLVNAADMMVNLLLDGASQEEIARTLYLLDKSEADGVIASAIREVVLAATPVEESPSLPVKVVHFLHEAFDRLVSWVWFQRAIVAVFIGHAIVFVVSALVMASDLGIAALLTSSDGSLAALGNLAASVVSSVMIVIGVIRLPINRASAYRLFKRSILVSIFLVQVFAFYESQMGALIGLAVDLVLLAGLNEMLHVEYSRREVRLTQQNRQDLKPEKTADTLSSTEYPVAVKESPATQPGSRLLAAKNQN